MDFRFSDGAECMDVKLEQISGELVIDIEQLTFRKSSAKNIEDILKNGISKNNQELVIDEICLSRDNYKKLLDTRYKASFITLIDVGNNVVSAAKVILGNVDLRYNNSHVKAYGDDIEIKLANMMAYPHGEYSFIELEDE